MDWNTWLPFILIIGLLAFCVGPMMMMGRHGKDHDGGKNKSTDSRR